MSTRVWTVKMAIVAAAAAMLGIGTFAAVSRFGEYVALLAALLAAAAFGGAMSVADER